MIKTQTLCGSIGSCLWECELRYLLKWQWEITNRHKLSLSFQGLGFWFLSPGLGRRKGKRKENRGGWEKSKKRSGLSSSSQSPVHIDGNARGDWVKREEKWAVFRGWILVNCESYESPKIRLTESKANAAFRRVDHVQVYHQEVSLSWFPKS